MKLKSKITILSISGIAILMIALGWRPFELLENKPKKIRCVAENLKVPSFTLLNLKGEKIDTSSFQGNVILLNFWATWCAPCRKEIPHLNELYNQYKNDGLVVIGIALDRGGLSEVQKFVEKLGVEYINLMGDEEVLEAFSSIPGMGPIPGIPTTFIIDRKGEICRRFVGLTEKKVFEEAIKQTL